MSLHFKCLTILAVGYMSPLKRRRGSGSMGPARNLILHLYDLFPSHGLLFFPCLLDYLVFPTHLIEDIY